MWDEDIEYFTSRRHDFALHFQVYSMLRSQVMEDRQVLKIFTRKDLRVAKAIPAKSTEYSLEPFVVQTVS